MISLDTADLLLLCALRDDSRLSLRDLGAKVSMSAPAVAARLRRLEENHVIEAYTVSINPGTFALTVEAVLYVCVNIVKEADFVSYMKKTLCVSSLYRLGADYTYMSIASFDSIEKLNNFALNLEQNYGKTKVQLVLKKEFSSRAPMDLKTLEQKAEDNKKDKS